MSRRKASFDLRACQLFRINLYCSSSLFFWSVPTFGTFGCDDCQDVCPWNRFAARTPCDEFLPRESDQAPPLLSLIHLSTEQFLLRFAGTAVLRAGRDGFVRNVVVALGNSCSPNAIDALSVSVRDKSALLRAHAAWALGRKGGTAVQQILADVYTGETAPDVREEIRLALADTAGSQSQRT